MLLSSRKSLSVLQRHLVSSLRISTVNATQSARLQENQPLPYEAIPQPKSAKFFGTVLDYLTSYEADNFFDHVISRHKELGPIYREQVLRGFTDKMVVCSSPEDSEVMRRNEGRYPQRQLLGFIKKARQKLNLHESIIELQGEEWHKIRQVINQHFLTNPSVWFYGDKHYQVAKDFVDFIEKNLDDDLEVPQFEELLKRWSFEATGAFALDTRLGLFSREIDPLSQQLIRGMDKTMDGIKNLSQPPQLWRLFNTKEFKTFVEGQKEVSDAVQHHLNLVKEKSSELTRLEQLVHSSSLTDKEKATVMMDFIGAGVETTAGSAIFVLYSLASNPEKQEKLRQEIKQKFDEANVTGKVFRITLTTNRVNLTKNIIYELYRKHPQGLHQLPYLNATLREVQRLFPFSGLLSRVFEKDVILSNYVVPAGTVILNSSNLINNRDPRFFDNPDVFEPERWLDQQQRNKAKFATVGSFGSGATMCPGRKFALQELHCLVIALLQRYRLEYHYKPIKMKFRAVSIASEKPRFKFVRL